MRWRLAFRVSNITDFLGNAMVVPFVFFGVDYFLSSIFASENRTDDISDWYGTCWASASSFILSRIGRGIRMLITQSDLLNALYAAYSFSKDSMFIMNNCCITFGICKLLYFVQYCGLYNELYQCKYNCQYKYIYKCRYLCNGGGVGVCVAVI